MLSCLWNICVYVCFWTEHPSFVDYILVIRKFICVVCRIIICDGHPNCRKLLGRGYCQSCQVSSTCKTLRYIRPRFIMDIPRAAMMAFLFPSSHWLAGYVCRWTCIHSPKDRYRKPHYDLSYHPDSKYRTGSNLPPVSHWYWHRNTLPNKWLIDGLR